MPLKKPVAGGASTSGPPPKSWEGSCLSKYSSLMEFLFSASWEDGSKRALGTLALLTSGGLVQVKLRDVASGIYAFFSADTLDGAFMLAEKALQEGSGDWRRDEWAGKRQPGK